MKATVAAPSFPKMAAQFMRHQRHASYGMARNGSYGMARNGYPATSNSKLPASDRGVEASSLEKK